jgi:hypothetical protein
MFCALPVIQMRAVKRQGKGLGGDDAVEFGVDGHVAFPRL